MYIFIYTPDSIYCYFRENKLCVNFYLKKKKKLKQCQCINFVFINFAVTFNSHHAQILSQIIFLQQVALFSVKFPRIERTLQKYNNFFLRYMILIICPLSSDIMM